MSSPSLQPEEPRNTILETHASTAAREIRQKHATDLLQRLTAGEGATPIREATAMVEACRVELIEKGLKKEASNLLNLTIGDINTARFKEDANDDGALADSLGLNAYGPKRRDIFDAILRAEQEAQDKGENIYGYQAEATGLHELCEAYASLTNLYSPVRYSEKDVVISGGGLPGFQMLINSALQLTQEQERAITFIAPIPGFTLVDKGVERALTPKKQNRNGENDEVIYTPVGPETGYCITPDALVDIYKKRINTLKVLYLVPMGNPTSTIFHRDALLESLDVFHALAPDGYVFVDNAYTEMVGLDRAKDLFSAFTEADVIDQVAMVSSISKIFGGPKARSAGILTKNEGLRNALGSTAQVDFASQAMMMEREAVARIARVPYEVRTRMYDHMRRRQDILLQNLRAMSMRREQTGQGPLIDFGHIHHELPMYMYARLAPGVNFAKLFAETGIAGVPGTVFGDTPKNNMIRFSFGIEPQHLVP